MKRTLLIFAFLTAAFSVSAQKSARSEYDFALYLLGGNLMADAVEWADGAESTAEYSPAAADTLNYTRGWVYYMVRRFDSAAEAFGKVSAASSFYPKSTFYGAVCHVELGRAETARELLDSFDDKDGRYAELLAFEKAGVALLQGRSADFDALKTRFTYDSFALSEQEKLLTTIASTKPKRLSPWIAGAASAVVPGLGKIYAGNVGEGIASFLIVGALAGITAESWVKAGTPLNWRTILYGSACTVLYISNIFGSAASVRVYYEQFNENRSRAVMYGIHIPLRAIFD